MARVHRFDPVEARGGGPTVLTHPSQETHRKPSAQQSSQQLIRLSLQPLAAPRSTESARVPGPLQGGRRADPPRTHPSIQGV